MLCGNLVWYQAQSGAPCSQAIAASSAQPDAIPLFNLYSQWVYALKGADVRDVMVNGPLLVEGRKPLTLDSARIHAAIAASLKR